MVTGKRIIESLTSSPYKFKFTQYTWTKTYLPNYIDIGFQIEINGQTFLGRGTALNENDALTKAVVEALERSVCKHHNIHTNGVAAHFDFELAKVNAKNEFIERDSALCHYLTQTPMSFLDLEKNIENDLEYEKLSNILKSIQIFKGENIRIQFFKCKPFENLSTVVCVAFGEKALKPFGLILGMGCHVHIFKALESAFLECASNIAYVQLLQPTRQIETDFTEDSILKTSSDTPLTHFEYALNINTPAKIELFFKPSIKVTQQDTLINKNYIFNYKTLNTDFLKLDLLPKLYVVKAECSDMQNMFYGTTDESKINLKRLNEFKKSPLSFQDINKELHIFG
ncbi:MAG: YcaO-like family protein [Pseudobdellovibrio sp.]